MKVISLIPFVIGLIGYENCVKDSEDTWKYGPEYIFRMSVNESFEFNDTNNFLCSNVTIILSCRPFASANEERTDALQCFVKNAQLQNSDVDKSTNPPKVKEDGPMESLKIGEYLFELLYDKKGIKEIKIDSKLVGWHLNMLRSVASHLNFGFDKFDKGGERFAVVEDVSPENSTIGDCETSFEVSKQIKAKGKQWNSTCGDKIHLETYAYGTKNPMIAMDKTRNVKKCTKSTPYVFGADEITKKQAPILKTEMISSVTSFFVASHSFQSSSQNRAHISTSVNETLQGVTNEFISLYLESIKPATVEFKRIPSPSTTTIFANDEIRKS